MIRRVFRCASLFLLLFPATSLAFSGDLALPETSVRFSSEAFLEGKNVRIYAAVANKSQDDLRGVVRFFDGGEQIQGDQPISALAGKEDSVFVDWKPSSGLHTVKIALVPFDKDDDDPTNNTFEKNVEVAGDLDRDGIPDSSDPDDDNDGVPDGQDAFPRDKSESLDSDGDRIGNNRDDDDDNDDVKDADDAFPLDANESRDTDRDGIGDLADNDDDGDGIPDVEEVKIGTNPAKADTDGDTVNDKEDGWPLDATRLRDYDKDGVEDRSDYDADNDGIPKNKDVDDTNIGPKIVITVGEKAPKTVVMPGEAVLYETPRSSDPDGKIIKTEWIVKYPEKKDSMKGETVLKRESQKLELVFDTPGKREITVKMTDDKGESREHTFAVRVIPSYLPWLSVGLLFVIIILALFFLFSYSRRRQSKLARVTGALETFLKILPKPKKGK